MLHNKRFSFSILNRGQCIFRSRPLVLCNKIEVNCHLMNQTRSSTKCWLINNRRVHAAACDDVASHIKYLSIGAQKRRRRRFIIQPWNDSGNINPKGEKCERAQFGLIKSGRIAHGECGARTLACTFRGSGGGVVNLIFPWNIQITLNASHLCAARESWLDRLDYRLFFLGLCVLAVCNANPHNSGRVIGGCVGSR